MPSALSLPFWKYRREVDGRRALSIALVILIHILGGIMLFNLSPPATRQRLENELKAFNVLPPPPEKKKPSVRVAPRKRPSGGAAPRTPVPPRDQAGPLNMLLMSSQDFAASDISKIHSTVTPSGNSNGNSSGEGNGPSGTGDGPGGDKLYRPDWYREPTQAEMATYMPHNIRAGWGEVACKTAPDFRVEDCRELEETAGSGIARAVREASWQFRVRPPRLGGKPLIGVWVRIRYDVILGLAK
jgi:protein TonB